MPILDDDISLRQRDPFSSKSPKYFVTPELNQRLNLIRHLIQNSEQLLLVLAETGCGKTALLNQLKKMVAKHHEHWWVYTLQGNPALSADTLISTLLSSFKVRQNGKPSQILQDSLRNHLTSTRYNGQLPVLLVDDAHLLPLATLKLIMELAIVGESLTKMRVVLFCEPQMTSILATPEFDMVHHTLIHTLDIPTFSKSQTRDYIQFRLEGTRYTTIHPFNSDMLKKIYVESEGLPGEINLYAQEVLKKFTEQRADFLWPHSFSRTKLLWGIPIVVILLSLLLFVYWPFSTSPLPELPPLPPASSFQPLSPAPLSPPAPPLVPPPVHSALAEALPVVPPSPLVSAISPPPSAADLVPADLLGRRDVKNQGWLLRQNAETYTVQLLGAYDYSTLKNFLTQYSLTGGGGLAMFKTFHNGKEWFVLVSGVYSNRSQATVALEQLPEALRKGNPPWIRKMANIQKEIQVE